MTGGPRILVTGSTGNVGSAVLRQLRETGAEVVAGVRAPAPQAAPDARQVRVDFETGVTPDEAFDAIFLVRPPHLMDPALFRRFLEPFDRRTRIVFLSVVGAERLAFLPHAKIERVIEELGFAHTFVRPGYFMDNLTTTLWPEMQRNRRVYLPAGRLALDYVSVEDVAALAVAALLGRTTRKALVASGGRKTGFAEVCRIISATAGVEVRYVPATLVGYIGYSRGRGMAWNMIFVMLMLHFLPRFGRSRPPVPGDVAPVLGRPPETLEAFVARRAETFRTLAPPPPPGNGRGPVSAAPGP